MGRAYPAATRLGAASGARGALALPRGLRTRSRGLDARRDRLPHRGRPAAALLRPGRGFRGGGLDGAPRASRPASCGPPASLTLGGRLLCRRFVASSPRLLRGRLLRRPPSRRGLLRRRLRWQPASPHACGPRAFERPPLPPPQPPSPRARLRAASPPSSRRPALHCRPALRSAAGFHAAVSVTASISVSTARGELGGGRLPGRRLRGALAGLALARPAHAHPRVHRLPAPRPSSPPASSRPRASRRAARFGGPPH